MTLRYKHQLKGLNSISLKKKLITIYIAAVFIPICIICFFLTKQMANMAMANYQDSAAASLAQLENNYVNILSNYNTIMDNFINDYSIMRYISTDYQLPDDAVEDFKRDISQYVRRMYGNYNMKFRVFSANSSIYFSEEMNNSIADLEKENWYLGHFGNQITWTSARTIKGRYSGHYIGCYRFIPHESTSISSNSVIAVFFDEAQFYSLISTEQNFNNIVFLCDQTGKIISTTERELLFQSIDQVNFIQGTVTERLDNNQIINYNGKKYFCSESSLMAVGGTNSQWTIINLKPADKLFNTIKTTYLAGSLLGLICVLLSILLVSYITGNLSSRIESFLKNMKEVWNSNFAKQVEVTGTDEIGHIETGFNELADKTYKLINEVYLANLKVKGIELTNNKLQAEKAHAQLLSLRRQINPHYLFNTLETIRMNILLEGDRKNAYILGLFAESFRACIEDDGEEYPLSQEIEFIEKYFEIQRYRFREKIDFSVHVPDELMNCLIPKQIIQPLTENALYHGIELKGTGGCVSLTAVACAGVLAITIADDGVGIEKNLLVRLQHQLEYEDATGYSGHGDRIALRNVNSRLKLQFGSQYGLQLSSNEGQGTHVMIRLPEKHLEGE
ncbi:MAG: histidine kinase [Clostridiaceae bacterium]|nr:histidine kinase [Clostridiaceae bacterium]